MADASAHGRLNPAQHQAVLACLQTFADAVPGVHTAVLSTVDGFAVLQSSGSSGKGERLAAMTSAMLALAAAVGRELALGELEVLLLEAGEGKVLMRSIAVQPAPLLLMAACDQRSVIGNVMWSAKECGQKIVAELSGA